MKIARVIDIEGRLRTVGLAENSKWVLLTGDLTADGYRFTDEVVVPNRWLPPTNPPAIFCIGLNYAKHILESKMPRPKEPVVFMKNPAAVTGHDGVIRIPRVCDDEVDFEGELAVIIGKSCRDVRIDEAFSVILGYTIANDISARNWQLHRGGSQWTRGKSFDTFSPLGPCIVTHDELEDPNRLAIRTTLNGETLQDSNTADMIFDVPSLISFCSQDTTLLAGSVIMTGTPEGIGWTRSPRRTLKHGDDICVEIEGIGSLKNHVCSNQMSHDPDLEEGAV
jgi:2-keto-4-pentenoate hydratase/2-oxohepta-3-ene-1,7-dioic acid hydratase in catechol pathway